MQTETKTVKGFTWVREDRVTADTSERVIWRLLWPVSTHFVLKNYGGKPDDSRSFSGIRLVSGGPFTNAGGWTDYDTAMVEVAPYLTWYIQGEVATAEARAKKLRDFLHEIQRSPV